MKNNRVFFTFLLLSLLGVFVWSFIDPRNRSIWFLDASPAIIALILLLLTYRRFPFTRLAYVLIWAFAVMVLVGAHYTYSQVPLFDWLRDILYHKRNNFDRLVHFTQGFVPAIVAREILLRKTPLLPGKMLFFLVICVCLAASAFVEVIEWWAAIVTSSGRDAFLGFQGDRWDTQKDMFLCFLGSVASQLLLVRMHNRQLRRLADASLLLKMQEKS
jgi:putative membrane protein